MDGSEKFRRGRLNWHPEKLDELMGACTYAYSVSGWLPDWVSKLLGEIAIAFRRPTFCIFVSPPTQR
jgi:hypothetical protein